MPVIKPLNQAADKWSRRSSVAAPDYADGVRGKSSYWEDQSKRSEGAYKDGVSKAAAAGRYGKGLTGKGGKWQEGVLRKGVGRYPEGVNLGMPHWQSGFQPYHQFLETLTLPARGARRSPQNLQRVQVVAQGLGNLYEKIHG